MTECIVESFRLLAQDCSDPVELADEFLSAIDAKYDLPFDQWMAVIDGVREVVVERQSNSS